MITVNKSISHGVGNQYIEGFCLSTDTKPTNGIENGSQLVEIDTGKLYFYDEEGGIWTAFN